VAKNNHKKRYAQAAKASPPDYLHMFFNSKKRRQRAIGIRKHQQNMVKEKGAFAFLT
jgi:hypothetical protein